MCQGCDFIKGADIDDDGRGEKIDECGESYIGDDAVNDGAGDAVGECGGDHSLQWRDRDSFGDGFVGDVLADDFMLATDEGHATTDDVLMEFAEGRWVRGPL